MKSKTSFFNATALKKNITRYAPIWAVYTIFWLLFLFNLAPRHAANAADNVLDMLGEMVWLNLIYGGLCAAFLFMDLFKSRLCNALHALPISREGWLTTHILSGLLFSLVPNLLITLLSCVFMWEYAYIPLIWFAVSTLQFLFFFGTAVLSAMCAGNLLGMVAIYGILHFGGVLIYMVAELFYLPLLHGIRFTHAVNRFFPVGLLSIFSYVDFKVDYNSTEVIGYFEGFLGKCWLYLGIYAIVGVIAFVLAWRVYRRRNLETAGDFLSLRPLSPVFLVVCTVGAGAIFYLLAGAFGYGYYILLAAGMFIGFFAGRMFLDRTVKVFTKKAFLGFGIIVVVVAGSMGLTWLDPVGITRYVPELDKVASIRIAGENHWYPYYTVMDSYTSIENNFGGFEITDPAEMAQVRDFHRQLTAYRPASDRNLCNFHVRYTLKNGKTVTRFYEVESDSPLGKKAETYFSDIRYLFEVDDAQILYKVFESVTVECYQGEKNFGVKLTDSQEIAGLIDAIQTDCNAGTMAQNWVFHDKFDENYYLDFSANADIFDLTDWDTSRFHLRVWTNNQATTAYIQKMLKLHPEA